MPFLHADSCPGATASILIGRWHPDLALPPGHAVLWLTDPAGLSPVPPGGVTTQVLSDPGTLESALDDFLHRSPKALPSLYITSGLPDEHSAAYAAAIDLVGVVRESHHRARTTRQQDAFTWQSNLYKNLPDYLTRRLPAAWKNTLANHPAAVCGAGPSLDQSIDALARAADAGAVIFAADSAWRTLSARGIPVDFVVSVDIAKTPDRCLPAAGVTHERVILAATGPPAWSQAVPADQRLYLASPNLTLDWLESQGIARPPVAVCEHCGATALTLARFLGCAPIALFGLDLALDDADLAHRHHAGADASLYKESGFNPAQDFPRVPGNFAATVPTHALGDWRALDERLATWPPGLVTAVTDRGAQLRNVQPIRPGDFHPATNPHSDVLAVLPTPAAIPEATQKSITTVFAAYAARLNALVHTLETTDLSNHVQILRDFLQVSDHDQLLGAFTLKILPHLLPPVDPNPAFWQANVEEIAALVVAARTAERFLLDNVSHSEGTR